MAELVYAPELRSGPQQGVGSSPTSSTSTRVRIGRNPINKRSSP